MAIWRMSAACCITKATNTHSQYVIIFAFPQQSWLYERASVLRQTYRPVLVNVNRHQDGRLFEIRYNFGDVSKFKWN